LEVLTQPGTEINVTPESDAPIIPNATRYHGALLLALKNVAVFLFFDVRNEIKSNNEKYKTTTVKTKYGLIQFILCENRIFFQSEIIKTIYIGVLQLRNIKAQS